MGMMKKVISDRAVMDELNKLNELRKELNGSPDLMGTSAKKFKEFLDAHVNLVKSDYLTKSVFCQNIKLALLSIKPDWPNLKTEHDLPRAKDGLPYCQHWGELVLDAMIGAILEKEKENHDRGEYVNTVMNVAEDVGVRDKVAKRFMEKIVVLIGGNFIRLR